MTIFDPGAARTGAVFTSLIMMVIVSKALNAGEPLSVTRTVTAFVLGPWLSVGAQVKTPLAGFMLAPAGAPASRLKVRSWAGTSESVALAVKVSRLSSLPVLFPIGVNTGAEFTSLTIILKVSKSLSGGK